MQYLSSYLLDAPCLSNGKKYSVFESVSLSLKIAALLLLIILFKYFYIAIAVWVFSFAANLFKRNLLYKYVYEIENGNLTVYKEYNAEKRSICENLSIKADIEQIYLGAKGEKYYEQSTKTSITVVKNDGSEFTLAVDDYFYALLNFYLKGETNDIPR